MKKHLALLVAGLISMAGDASAESAAIPDIPYSRFRLHNGLTVVVHEDHKAPVVAVGVWYHVGSADEPAGKSGFAHLFEHLMFSGSENHRGSFFKPFQVVGATDMNGTTSFDRTNYFETVPTTALDMALWMESDRMGHLLDAIGQEELDTQRGVVQNEKRQRENQPYGRVNANVLANVYPANHPYHHDTIGSMADLDAASLTDVKQWFHDYYGAANTTLVLAGDITPEQARAKAETYFGDIPAGQPVPRQQPWVVPLTADTRGVQHDHVAQTRVVRTWVVPQDGTAELTRLILASHVLGSDKTSRLYQRLVYQEQLADDVSVVNSAFALSSQLQISVDVKDGVDPARVEAAIAGVLNEFLAEGPTEDELERARTVIRGSFVRKLEKVGGDGKASLLAEGQLYRYDPTFYKTEFENIHLATPASVLAAANRWLSQGSYTLTVMPADDDFDPTAEDDAVVGIPYAEGRPQPIALPAESFTVGTSLVDRSLGVPTVASFPSLSFPALQRGRLKNGMEVVLAERHAVPVTQVQLVFDGGYAADQGRKPGTASFTTSLLDEGTSDLDSVEVARHEQLLGATVDSRCLLDVCVLSLNALSNKLVPSLELFADIVRHPAFHASDVERVRGQWIAGIGQEKANPSSLALRTLPPLLYGRQHAYGIPFTGSGTEDAIESLTVDDFRAFQRDYLRPDNARIVVVGDTTLEAILRSSTPCSAIGHRRRATFRRRTSPWLRRNPSRGCFSSTAPMRRSH